ncbi:unnamed protein product [Auanema sp. JU1783]|nr:unnamed protein product [Auanema sp. JU1783]
MKVRTYAIYVLLTTLGVFLCDASTKHNGIGPITDHFKHFLDENGYSMFDFPRADMSDFGSFGGKKQDSDKITNYPVVFIHGNSDAALTANSFSTGWTNTVNYFIKKGYNLTELYATSWGNTIVSQASYRKHDCKTVIRLRKFVEAVLAYTKADKINFITHSMGVTLGRKVIAGGKLDDLSETCDVGSSLASKVNVFLGLSGANFGLCSCASSIVIPTCNVRNGFYPGDFCGPQNNALCGKSAYPPSCLSKTYSEYLMNLNQDSNKIADKTFSAWSQDDELLGNKNYVWGNFTSLIVHSTGHKIYNGLTHMQTKENTSSDQFLMITTGTIPK